MSTDIELILKKYKPGRREDLIPILQEVQKDNGYLSEAVIVRIGSFVGLSTTKIYGLATFYDQFRFIPAGKLRIKICNGTTCFLNNSQAIMNKVSEITGLLPGQTTRDGLISYDIVTCMGGCDNSPVLKINGEYYPSVKVEQIPEMIKKLRYIIEND